MIHPLLTLIFDLFLIGSALSITAAMASEYVAHRGPVVGRSHAAPVAAHSARCSGRARVTAGRRPQQNFRVGVRG